MIRENQPPKTTTTPTRAFSEITIATSATTEITAALIMILTGVNTFTQGMIEMTSSPPVAPALCPFCGDALIENIDDGGHFWTHPGRDGFKRSDCWLCDVVVENTVDEIAAWNRRSPVPSPSMDALRCCDCQRPYEKGPDLVVSDADWAKIAPRPDGGGVLCPNCMNDRFEAAGLHGIQAKFTSGPFASPSIAPLPDGGEVEKLIAETEARRDQDETNWQAAPFDGEEGP
jgi:hypothetical protein